MPAPQPPTWEQVLADCEAAAAAAEALLAGVPESDPEVVAARAEYDLWQLNLPPLPTELLDRAHAVHQRQQRLEAALRSAMMVIDQHRHLSSDGAESRPGAMYLNLTA